MKYFQYEKYQDQFKEQYEPFIRQFVPEDLLRKATASQKRNEGNQGMVPLLTPTPEPPKPMPLLDEFII